MLAEKINIIERHDNLGRSEFLQICEIQNKYIRDCSIYKNYLSDVAKKYAIPFYSWPNIEWERVSCCSICKKGSDEAKYVHIYYHETGMLVCKDCLNSQIPIYLRNTILYYVKDNGVVSLDHKKSTLYINRAISIDKLYDGATSNAKLLFTINPYCVECRKIKSCKCLESRVNCIFVYETRVKLLLETLFCADIAAIIVKNIMILRREFWNLFSNFSVEIKAKYCKTRDQWCCGCGKISKMVCGKCKIARYCSRECQRNDWNNHKNYCQLQ